MLKGNDYNAGADDVLKEIIEGLQSMVDEGDAEDSEYYAGAKAGLEDALDFVRRMRIELYG